MNSQLWRGLESLSDRAGAQEPAALESSQEHVDLLEGADSVLTALKKLWPCLIHFSNLPTERCCEYQERRNAQEHSGAEL